jgi:acetoin utilization deacetylase AcuC-like enzyme
MKLTKPGLLERDRFVLESCRAIGLPVTITMAGGYAKYVEDTADIHFQTVKLVVGMMRGA